MSQLLLPPHIPKYYIGMDVAKKGSNDFSAYVIIDETGIVVEQGLLDHRRLTLRQTKENWEATLEVAKHIYKDITVLKES